MNIHEILQKAIEKAMENGYEPEATGSYRKRKNDIKDVKIHYYRKNNIGVEFIANAGGWIQDFQKIIFDQEFAKALFGWDWIYTQMDWGGVHEVKPQFKEPTTKWEAYRFHLMKMVLSDDPIKYLEKYV
jgi:hypothetical protein